MSGKNGERNRILRPAVETRTDAGSAGMAHFPTGNRFDHKY